jgi:uncharacterized membrane protein
MPLQWVTELEGAPAKAGAFLHQEGHPPAARLQLWPHRSLPPEGFVWFLGGTAAFLALPLVGVLGTPILWGLLPFMGIALAAIWWALKRSYADGQMLEELTLWQDRIEIVRHDPRRPPRSWQADPYWVRVELRSDGPVENYLTLHGAGREVELGAFLSPEERAALHGDLSGALARLR